MPSFARYRRKSKDPQQEIPFSMLNDESAGPLAGYAPYGDFTIGRSFIVTHFGLMGIAPSSAKRGDVVVRVQTDGRVVWLVFRDDEPGRVEDMSSPVVGEGTSETDTRRETHIGTFRLVGEASIDKSNCSTSPTEEMQCFNLW